MHAVLDDLETALGGGQVESGGTPWLAWMLVALCRQRARQDWLFEIRRERLADVDDFCGDVPGLPAWTFEFHGDGLCLTGPGGEIVDVTGDAGPQTIDPYAFVNRVLHLEPRPRVEERVVQWGGASRELMWQMLHQLRRDGLVVHPSSKTAFRLHAWLEARYADVAAVDFDDDGTWLRWSQAVGGSPSDGDRDGFRDWALALLSDRSRARVIEGLAGVLPRADVEAACLDLMTGPVDSVTGRSIQVLRTLGRSPGAHATALLHRLDPTVHNPFSAVELAEWLFENGDTETALALIHRFAAQREIRGFRGNPFDDRYAVLALRFVPSEAPTFVRLALRSQVPNALECTAALLSVLDAPWCREELLSAAQERTDPAAIRFIVGCLMYSSDPVVLEAAKALVPPPPDVDPEAVGYTFEEVQFANLRQLVERRRTTARKVASRLRHH